MKLYYIFIVLSCYSSLQGMHIEVASAHEENFDEVTWNLETDLNNLIAYDTNPTLLEKAAWSGNLNLALETLLDISSKVTSNPDKYSTLIINIYVNKKNINGRSALHIAAAHGNCEITKLLINFGAEVNIKDNLGRTPLHYAVLAVSVKTVKLLLEKNAKANFYDDLGYTPLHLAVNIEKTNTVKIIKELLEHSANINSKNKEGLMPLELALLINNTSTENSIYNLLLFYINPDKFIAELSDINKRFYPGNYTVLMWAIIFRDLDYVKLLLANNAKVNILDSSNKTPLMYAAYYGNSDIFSLLVTKKAKINTLSLSKPKKLRYLRSLYETKDRNLVFNLEEGNNALIYAIKGKNKAIICSLVENCGAIITSRAIKLASDLGLEDIAVYLLLQKLKIGSIANNT